MMKIMIKLHKLHNDLPFIPEIMKIKQFRKLVCNLYDKEKYFAHIRTVNH